MTDRVIHIPDETHGEFKAECQRRNVRMRDVIDQLIRNWLLPRDVVSTKPLPPQEPPSTAEPYTLPPFWAGRESS
jgi:hypothetical protein